MKIEHVLLVVALVIGLALGFLLVRGPTPTACQAELADCRQDADTLRTALGEARTALALARHNLATQGELIAELGEAVNENAGKAKLWRDSAHALLAKPPQPTVALEAVWCLRFEDPPEELCAYVTER